MDFKRFDFIKEPQRFKWYLRPIAAALTIPNYLKYKPIIRYHNDVEKLKNPFLLLCNHNAFLDFSIAYKLLKGMYANFVVAIDGFIAREKLLRNVGCICKRKFTNDILLIRNLKKVIDRGDVPVIYPEARYSLCGTTAVLPSSLGKLIKLLKVNVATLICHGHHINSPFWDTSHERGINHDEADYTWLFKKEELETLSVDEINDRLVKAFQYDDFKWQKDNKIVVNDERRADGLEKVLYKCPHCNKEFKMKSDGKFLYCEECGAKYEMTEFGELKCVNKESKFTHIPDWYEWERECVKKEISDGTYSTGLLKVKVKSLPNADNFIDVGSGTLIHDMNGFYCKLDDDTISDTKEIKQGVLDTYSVHIEYRYLFKNGDCIDLNTINDTWYVYPEGNNFSVTKIALATEELYFAERKKKGFIVKPGLT